MFPRRCRLVRERDIRAVLRAGRSYRSPHLTVRFLQNTLDHRRMTVVVGTKISKRAVVRNRMKRILRSLFQELWPHLPDTTDYAIFVRQKIDGDLRNSFEQELRPLPLFAHRTMRHQ